MNGFVCLQQTEMGSNKIESNKQSKGSCENIFSSIANAKEIENFFLQGNGKVSSVRGQTDGKLYHEGNERE